MLIKWKDAYRSKIKNEKAQLFDVFKFISSINLCNHMTQWKVANKKSNVLILYYIDVYVKKDIRA